MSLKLNERYPGRFNNPSGDYPQGSFKNRTAPSAKDGSYLEQDWANDKEGFFQSLLSAAGLEANGSVDKVGASQFFDAIQKLKQSQSGTAFPATGPSAALVLTPAPAITQYVSGQRFRVKFNRASTGADTINVSGAGPKILKQYDATGAKVAAIFAINQLSDVEYDGADFVVLDPLPSNPLVDPWALQPVGVPIPVFYHLSTSLSPPTDKSYRYISLTANDSYNSGVLTGEAVSGSAPLVIATSVISLAGSPINGKTVNMINTEQRVVRGADLSGQILQDALQNITGTVSRVAVAGAIAGSGAFQGTRLGAAAQFEVANNYGDFTFDASRVARTGVETRAKSISAVYFMRIK